MQGQLCSQWTHRGHTAVHLAALLSSEWEILRLLFLFTAEVAIVDRNATDPTDLLDQYPFP